MPDFLLLFPARDSKRLTASSATVGVAHLLDCIDRVVDLLLLRSDDPSRNESFWRYRRLTGRIADYRGGFTAEEMKETNVCVNVLTAIEPRPTDDLLRATPTRTVWHSNYD